MCVEYKQQQNQHQHHHQQQQESDLASRLKNKQLSICVHMGTFVYHFKGQTIPLNNYEERNAWRRADADPGQAH